MQLWKKNFLVTFFMFLMVIQGGLFIMQSFLYQNELEQWRVEVVSNEKSLLYFLAEIENSEEGKLKQSTITMLKGFAFSGVRLSIELDGAVIINQIPEAIKKRNTVGIVRDKGAAYILISDSILKEERQISITYMQSMGHLQQNQKNRILLILGIGILLSMVIGVMLYLTMKRINKPVSQIAHELRTPLTGVQGYAQYLMMGNLTEEDRFYAAQQIVESAQNLNDIVEKLLIIGGVREGTVKKQKLNLQKLFEEMKKEYPIIQIECRNNHLQADPTLVRCLLENLIQNSVAGGTEVKVYADEYCMTVWNDGGGLSGKKLKWLNRSQGVPQAYADRHGLGVRICHEITEVHGWKLFYRSLPGEGITAEILF